MGLEKNSNLPIFVGENMATLNEGKWMYINIPAPSKGCQINPKGWLIDTP